MKWNSVSIEKIAEIRGGKRLPSGHDFSTFPTDHLYIRARDIHNGKIFGDDPVYITEQTAAILSHYTVEENDIVITIVGANIGDIGFITKEFEGANLTENAAKIKVPLNVCNPKFLQLQLSTEATKRRFQSITAGSAQGKLGLYKIKDFPIQLPPVATQNRIADILSAYDDLIENNRRRIDLLEQSARMLYREWFVSLRFPGHEHVKVKNGVPVGWEKLSVGNLSIFLSRGITPIYDDEAECIVINQKCIRDGLLNLGLARHQKKEVSKDKLVRHGDVLINSTGEGTLGRIAQMIDEVENCTVDSHVTIVRPSKNIGQYYFGITLIGQQDYLSIMGRGATNQTELSRETIANIEILVPPSSISFEFEEIVKNLYSQITNLLNQNKYLTQARDLLLPRLMNGEIEV